MYTHEIGLDFFVTFLGFDHLGNFLLSGFGSFFVLGWVGLIFVTKFLQWTMCERERHKDGI